MFDRCCRISPLLFIFFLVLPAPVEAGAIRDHLMRGLSFERHLPPVRSPEPSEGAGILYILGGRQESLLLKMEIAGRLYAGGEVRKILFLHRPGITEFAQALGRNYTNDEWAMAQMEKVGIDIGDVEFVRVAPALFSTLSEGRVITALSRSRGYRRLVLVTSMHHTGRAWRSFDHFNRDKKLDLYIYGSEEKAGILDFLGERLKLFAYRCFIFAFGIFT